MLPWPKLMDQALSRLEPPLLCHCERLEAQGSMPSMPLQNIHRQALGQKWTNAMRMSNPQLAIFVRINAFVFQKRSIRCTVCSPQNACGCKDMYCICLFDWIANAWAKCLSWQWLSEEKSSLQMPADAYNWTLFVVLLNSATIHFYPSLSSSMR